MNPATVSMASLVTAGLVILLSVPVQATEQDPDILHFKGSVYSLLATPLEMYFKPNEASRPVFETAPGVFNMTNKRGYVATWRIADNKLTLVDIQTTVEGRPTSVEDLFAPEPVASELHAAWFTGEIRASSGRLLSLDWMGFSSRYENELVFSISNGMATVSQRIQFQKKEDGLFSWFVSDDEKGERLGPYCTSCLRKEPDLLTTARLIAAKVGAGQDVWFCNRCEALYDESGKPWAPNDKPRETP